MLADGGTVHLRPVRPDDGDKLQDLYSRLSEESLYLRFFSPVSCAHRAPARADLARSTTTDASRSWPSSATTSSAIARYDRTGADEGGAAEVAFSVQDDQHGRGLGSILLEHLAAVARDAGIRRFEAWTMPNNHKMLRVFSDAGFVVSRRFDAGTVEVSFDIEQTPESVAVQRDREHTSEARSMGRMLAPRTIAVVGAGRRRGDDRPRGAAQPSRGRVHRPRVPGASRQPRRSPACAPTPPSPTSPTGSTSRSSPSRPPRSRRSSTTVSRAGVQGLVIISAGFAEVGGDNARRGARHRARSRVATACG